MSTRGSGPDDQAKKLEDALQVVKVQAFQMKRCLDKSKLMDALKHASTMLGELRASELSPKSYYELYMAVSDEVRHLQMYLQDEYQSQEKVSELYELVQYAGNIVPRLYLLITVGVVYIRLCEHMKKEILKDLVEMCRGVQHPLRGLFLRNYLLQTTKNSLPDAIEQTEEGCGDSKDSIDYILTNFAEMNKLWVRMQHQGHSRDRERRERERQELRILVGTNLVRLSQLENIDVDLYTTTVLPGVLEQVVSCKDPISQEYLMECIIQVFPDDFHLRTLHMFLEGCAGLNPKVTVKNILNSMINRLATYALREDAVIPEDLQLFDVFSAHISAVIDAHTDMPPADIVSLMTALTNLALKCFSGHNEYVNKTMDYCRKVLANRNITCVDNTETSNSACSKELMKLVKIPIDNYPTIATVLELQNASALWMLFGYDNRKSLALYVVQKMLATNEIISNPETLAALLDLLSPLVEDQEDQAPSTDAQKNDEGFIEEQTWIARLIHNWRSDDLAVQNEILTVAKKRFGFGGEARIKYTIPPMIDLALGLIISHYDNQDEDETWMKKVQKLFQFALKLITTLNTAGSSDLALRLFLSCASVADRLKLENLADEFMIRALLVYEDNISGSKAQSAAIAMLVGTLEKLCVFTQENYDKLSLKCALHAAQLLTKPDQTRAICLASHLFWSGKTTDCEGEIRNGKKVLDCLQKSLKIADSCVDSAMKLQLFVEILDKYIYYFDQKNEYVTTKYLSNLIDLINTNMAEVDTQEDYEETNRHFQNTLAYIRHKKEEPDEGGPSYEDLNV